MQVWRPTDHRCAQVLPSVFGNNTLKGEFLANSSATVLYPSSAAGLDIRHAITKFTNVTFEDNVMKRSRGAIFLINSGFDYSNLRFDRNVILQPLGQNCTDVARMTRFRNASSPTKYSYVNSGCTKFKDGVALKPPTRMPTMQPPPTPKPTKRPSTPRPTRKPTIWIEVQ